ncbi:MAG: hypothetical protein AAFV19_08460 [Pseudomonadota bacterium]
MPDLKFDANGKYYKCFPQQNKMSCGVACIRMVNHYLTGKDIGAAVVRHYVGLVERPEARPAMRGGVVPQATAHNFETTGISLTTAAKALHSLRPPRLWHLETQAHLDVMKTASPTNPMLVSLKGVQGFWHLMVAVDTIKGGGGAVEEVVVVDPGGPTIRGRSQGRIGTVDAEFGIYDIGGSRNYAGIVAAIHMRNGAR